MTELAAVTSERAMLIAAAAQKTALREAGIRAQAIGEGMKKAREEFERALGGYTLEQFKQRQIFAEAQTAEILRLRFEWAESAAHQRRGSFWQAFALSGALFAGVSACATAAAMSSGMFGFAAVQHAIERSPYEPPPSLTTHAPSDPYPGPQPAHPREPASAPSR